MPLSVAAETLESRQRLSCLAIRGTDEMARRLDPQERALSDQQCAELEAPENSKRWRKLEGRDPEPEDLAAKLQVLEERVNDKKEQLLEKDLVLEEVSNLANRLRTQALEGREDTLELAKRVNDFQTRIKVTTRRMMATVSELSMYQATAMKLQQHKRVAEAHLEQPRARRRPRDGRLPRRPVRRRPRPRVARRVEDVAHALHGRLLVRVGHGRLAPAVQTLRAHRGARDALWGMQEGGRGRHHG